MKQIMAFDRRNAALHEAGHVVTAWHRGIHAEAMIKSETDGGEVLFNKTWTGQTRLGTWQQLGAADRLHIAVAGEIAVMRGRGDDLESVLDTMTWGEATGMSPSDWQLAGYQAGNVDRRFMPAVERVYKLLDREWPTVCGVARDLIFKARITQTFQMTECRIVSSNDHVVGND
jgi:hypothetical protein